MPAQVTRRGGSCETFANGTEDVLRRTWASRKTPLPTRSEKAFRKLAVKYHPDAGGDEQKFKEI